MLQAGAVGSVSGLLEKHLCLWHTRFTFIVRFTVCFVNYDHSYRFPYCY